MIAGVPGEQPDLAFDFAVAHRGQVDKLADSTSRARYYPGIEYRGEVIEQRLPQVTAWLAKQR